VAVDVFDGDGAQRVAKHGVVTSSWEQVLQSIERPNVIRTDASASTI